MSVRQDITQGSSSVARATAGYMPCEECNEGAVVWDEKKLVSRCFSCGNVYEGR